CLSLYGYNWYVTSLMIIIQMHPTYKPSLTSNGNEAEACLLPHPPRGTSYANYARCVNQIVQGLNKMQLWLKVLLQKSDNDAMEGDANHLVGAIFLLRGIFCISLLS
ncbi:hypothetical protein GIB67_031179, partial [Kingdonia uniflora]